MDSFQKLKDLVASAEADATKFENGNNAAGTRLRAAMQEVKGLAQDIRQEVLDKRHSEN